MSNKLSTFLSYFYPDDSRFLFHLPKVDPSVWYPALALFTAFKYFGHNLHSSDDKIRLLAHVICCLYCPYDGPTCTIAYSGDVSQQSTSHVNIVSDWIATLETIGLINESFFEPMDIKLSPANNRVSIRLCNGYALYQTLSTPISDILERPCMQNIRTSPNRSYDFWPVIKHFFDEHDTSQISRTFTSEDADCGRGANLLPSSYTPDGAQYNPNPADLKASVCDTKAGKASRPTVYQIAPFIPSSQLNRAMFSYANIAAGQMQNANRDVPAVHGQPAGE